MARVRKRCFVVFIVATAALAAECAARLRLDYAGTESFYVQMKTLRGCFMWYISIYFSAEAPFSLGGHLCCSL